MNKGKTLVLLAFLVAASLASAQENDSSSVMTDKVFTVGGVTFCMKPVPGGTFTMGATAEQGKTIWHDEYPTHEVTVSSFYMGETEVTQALWVAVMGREPKYARGHPWLEGHGRGDNYPAYCVSYKTITKKFIPKLEKMTGQKFRLPTEAEWEYAARGGHSGGTMYSGGNNIDQVAWSGYRKKDSDQYHPVKMKSPNALGLYDMSGNVWEWCSDWYDANYYSRSPKDNPMGPDKGTERVLRGGAIGYSEWSCRVARRGQNKPNMLNLSYGFRLVLCP